MNAVIVTFYEFLRKSSKILIPFLLLFSLCSWGLYRLKNDAQISRKNAQILPLHFAIQSALSKNLMGPCEFVKGTQFFENLQQFASKNQISAVISTEDLTKIDHLVFRQVFLLTHHKNTPEVFNKTSGFLAENTVTEECFGFI